MDRGGRKYDRITLCERSGNEYLYQKVEVLNPSHSQLTVTVLIQNNGQIPDQRTDRNHKFLHCFRDLTTQHLDFKRGELTIHIYHSCHWSPPFSFGNPLFFITHSSFAALLCYKQHLSAACNFPFVSHQ